MCRRSFRLWGRWSKSRFAGSELRRKWCRRRFTGVPRRLNDRGAQKNSRARSYRSYIRSMSYPTDFKYTKEHEWIKAEGKAATIGITSYAQDSLGDIVFVELPKVGTEITTGKVFGSVESVKAV